MSQPARFAARSRIIRDLRVSPNALRLFMFLDDEARGEDSISITQSFLSKAIGVTERHVRRLLDELIEFRYIRQNETQTANLYEFYRTYMSGSERTSAKGTGHGCPVVPDMGVRPFLIAQENPREESSPTPPLPVISDEDEDLTPLSEAVAEHVPAAAGDLREIVTAARRSKPAAPVEEIALAVRMSVPPKYPVRHHRYFVTAVPRMIASEWFRNAVAARAAPAVLSCGEYAPYEEPDAQRRGVA